MQGFGRKTFAPDAAPQLQDHLTSSNVGMVDGPVDGRPAGKKKFPDPILASYAREDEKERAEAEKAAATAQRNAAKHESAKAAADLERDLLAKYPHGVPRHVLHALKAQGAVPGSANLPNLGHGQFF